MRRIVPHKPFFQALCVVLICALTWAFILTAQAGLRGPGQYCGVVVFDRWDTCFLLSGPYITYISDAVKNELRPYKGKAMQVDASEVVQPMNPGDALIRKYKIVGPVPDTRHWVMLDGLELVAKSDFGPHGSPTFLIEMRNVRDKSIKVDSLEFGPALLGLSPKGPFCVSDGKSGAWITRGNLVNPSSWESGSGSVKYSASYTIDPKPVLLSASSLQLVSRKKCASLSKLRRGNINLWLGMEVEFMKKSPWRAMLFRST